MAYYVRLSAKLKEPWLFELHLCNHAVRQVAHMHEATMIDVELANDDIIY